MNAGAHSPFVLLLAEQGVIMSKRFEALGVRQNARRVPPPAGAASCLRQARGPSGCEQARQ